jgi:hypothetical protein
MVANPDLRKSEDVEGFLCLLDLREILACDGTAVLDARGETGAGGFVPELKTGLEGEGANLLFVEASDDEGGDGMVLCCSLLTRTKLGAVVEVHAICNVSETARGALDFHLGEELVFAVEAALGVVALVVRAVKLVGVKDVDGDVAVGRKGEGSGKFGAREGRGVGNDGLHVVAESKVGGISEVGGVGAAGVRDQNTAEVLQCGVEFGGFGCYIHLV